MTLRLSDDDAAALRETAEREHLSQHEVAVRAIRAYTSGRQSRLEAAVARVAERDAELLDRLGKA
jgi:predicted transcriptional regulator